MSGLKLILAASILLVSGQVGAAPLYTIEILPALGGPDGYASDINNLGYIAGLSNATSDTSNRNVTVWEGSTVSDLGVWRSGNEGGRPVTINDNGQIASTITNAGDPTAARWSGPTYSTLEILNPLPTHTRSEAADINLSGQVAGTSDSHAVRWTGTTPEALSPESQGSGFGINDSGQVSGYTVIDGKATAVRWDGTTAVPLDSLPGDTSSAGYAINNAGQVTGTNHISDKNRAVRWDGTNVVDLGLLPGAFDSRGWDINDYGWVVGASGLGASEVAILHDGSDLYNLNDLIIGPNPFDLLSIALGINDIMYGDIAGQIVGVGSVNNVTTAYLLTPVSPVPIPATFWLFGTGILGLIGFSERRKPV